MLDKNARKKQETMRFPVFLVFEPIYECDCNFADKVVSKTCDKQCEYYQNCGETHGLFQGVQ